jgi:hypothetical protein
MLNQIIELEDIQKKTIRVSFWNTQNLAPLIISNSFTEGYIQLKGKINLQFSLTIRKKTVKHCFVVLFPYSLRVELFAVSSWAEERFDK